MTDLIGRRLVLAEDDEDIRETTALLLTRHGFTVTAVQDGVEALTAIEQEHPDAVILDIAMPRLDGLALVRRLGDSAPPVIFLTARDLPSDVVHGLSLGADDYIAKPFDADVLVARIEAVIRRANRGAAPEEPIDGVTLDRHGKAVYRDGNAVAVSATEYRVLEALLDNRGNVLSRSQIVDLAWDSSWQDDRVVDTNVQRLRKKLGPDVIETVRGFGYRIPRVPL
ncbi:response regulator transcription factor [Curtobacterium ammoniigenes]|uniref:response regulator transcription factor n=1 Tax=Curtobacterium ammoniigenes TaxID=395387 RepID=UPI000834B5A5|nr:response regulator transcription factor [Curtobacterium ammoniigenes]